MVADQEKEIEVKEKETQELKQELEKNKQGSAEMAQLKVSSAAR